MRILAPKTDVNDSQIEVTTTPGSLIDGLPCVVFQFVWDAALQAPRFLQIGGACEEILGLEASRLLLDGTTLNAALHGDDAERVRDALRAAFTAHTDWRLKFQLSHAGNIRWIESHGRVSAEGIASGYFINVTECMTTQLEYERRMEERTRLWASVMEQSNEGIMVCDRKQQIVMVNAAFERMTGFTSDEAVGKTPRILQSGRQNRAFYRSMWRTVRSCGRWSGEIWNRRRSGELFLEWLTIKAVVDARNVVTHYVGTFSDITEHRATEARLAHLTEFDTLTNLPNRAGFALRLEHLIASAREAGSHLAVLYVDIDRFNDINDSLGHDNGDALLQAVARRMEGTLRRTDVVARVCADEFVVLAPEVASTTDAAGIAQKILDEIGTPLTLAGQSLAVSASVGICLYPEDGKNAEELTRNAVAAMMRAKHDRRNSYEFYTPGMNAQAARNLRIENELRFAIEHDELVLHYQPQVDLATRRVIGVEALVRWNKPGTGLLMPSQFMPIAEERGLLVLLGRWVVRRAVRQAREWQDAGAPPLVVSINVTASEFHHAGFLEFLRQTVQEHGMPASTFELELTESIAVQDLSGTAQTLAALHANGFRLSLDDFGTGYSSLSYLRHFPIDKIKIDQSFVRELSKGPDAIRIIRAIIGLAKSFSMRVIAEGVETEAQLSALRAESCDEAQGYLISKPLPPENLGGLLASWTTARTAVA